MPYSWEEKNLTEIDAFMKRYSGKIVRITFKINNTMLKF